MKTIAEILTARQETLATAESLTGGLIAEILTRQSGASAWFRGGFVVYTPKMKNEILGVPCEIFENYGVVSTQCAAKMAQGAILKSGATWALSATGIAGPDSIFENGIEKPVGLVCMGIARQNGEVFSYEKNFAGSRLEIRQQTADFLLDSFFKILNEN